MIAARGGFANSEGGEIIAKALDPLSEFGTEGLIADAGAAPDGVAGVPRGGGINAA